MAEESKKKKKRKGVQWKDDSERSPKSKPDEIPGKRKKFKPEDHFLKVQPKMIDTKKKDIVVLQVPAEVDLAQLNGGKLKISSKPAGKGGDKIRLEGTLATASGEKFGIHEEDELYAQQLYTLVPAGEKKLKIKKCDTFSLLHLS